MNYIANEGKTKTILSNLENLYCEIKHSESINPESSHDFIKYTIENACQECNFIDKTMCFLHHQMSLCSSLRQQIDQLTTERESLFGDLNSYKEQIINQEGIIATLESENSHLKYMIELNESPSRSNSIQPEENQTDLANNEGYDHFNQTQQPIPANLATLNSLVVQYASQGRYEVAVPLCKQALSELETVSGKDHPEVATLLNILALAYRDQGQYNLAAFYLERCLQIREKIFGSNHSSVAATLNNLAILLGKGGKYSEAEPLCKRALKIREGTLGHNHPDTAKQLNNLALICQHQGKYSEVEGYYLRALDIYRSLPDKDDINIMKTTNNLASAYLKLGKFTEAESLYKSVISEFQSKVVADSNVLARCVLDIADESDYSKNLSQRDSILLGILPNWIKVVDAYGASILTTLKNLSALYHRRGRHEAAEFIESLVKAVKSNCESLENMSNCSTIVSTDDI